ncbi:hypothetical protein OROGR_012648 [Orobanche gracilis]
MASFPKHLPIFILFTILAPIHTRARESQFFNKVSAKTNNDVVPAYSKPKQPQNDHPQQEPIFLQDNDNGYGLYGHESVQHHPSAVTTTDAAAESAAYKAEPKQPAHKHLPQNYNPVAYVTDPVDLSETTTSAYEEKRFPSNPDIDSFFYDGDRNYHNIPQEEDSEFRNNPTTTKKTGNANNDRYSLGSSFNSGGGGFLSRHDNYFNRGADGANGFEPQGMSDTRSLENGRYFYDVNTEKYSSNHPYESLKGFKERNGYDNRNYYGDVDIGYGGQDSMAGYQNQNEFQDEDNRNLRP